jgi:hypothetical protein
MTEEERTKLRRHRLQRVSNALVSVAKNLERNARDMEFLEELEDTHWTDEFFETIQKQDGLVVSMRLQLFGAHADERGWGEDLTPGLKHRSRIDRDDFDGCVPPDPMRNMSAADMEAHITDLLSTPRGITKDDLERMREDVGVGGFGAEFQQDPSPEDDS